jgi:D-glycero-alpha-D-manno-heptose-7-phosphate kinase
VLISRTPLRVSFVGGGSDVVSFAARYGGAVVSPTIDKYVYVIVNKRFEDSTRVSYSRTEIVDTIDQLEHELAREALRAVGLPRGTEIVTIADVPSEGTGLGSSSAVTVGLLNALFAYQGILKSPTQLAEEASRIEIDVLGKPIGKQDQYAAAFGGLQLLEFGPGDKVSRQPLVLADEQAQAFGRNLVMFYTGRVSTGQPLRRLDAVVDDPEVVVNLERLRDAALLLSHELRGGASFDVLGDAMHESWLVKRALPGVTDGEIDGWYEAARTAGATGGKLLGSGGGGFLLLYVPVERQQAVRQALGSLREFAFTPETEGTRIIHVGK